MTDWHLYKTVLNTCDKKSGFIFYLKYIKIINKEK